MTNSTGESSFDGVDDNEWEPDSDMKIMTQIRTVRAAIPCLKDPGGERVIHLNRAASKQPGAGKFPMVVSRTAGLVQAKALSEELAGFKILNNEVAVANVIAFLASDAAGYVASTCICVDRGWTAVL